MVLKIKKMFKGILCALTSAIMTLSFTSCGGGGYESIGAEEAKRIMDSGVEYFLIDARTDSEYGEGHIPGAVMIPEYEISESVALLPAEKDALILVYCRSGRRSKIASEELVKLGYTNVKEFGGIIDWKYDITK